MKQLLEGNFALLLTLAFALIGGTVGVAISPGVTKRDIQPRLIESLPDPACYPGYNTMPPKPDPSQYQSVIKDFQDMVYNDAQAYMGFTQMFEQIPNTPRYQTDTANIGPVVRNIGDMLYRLNRSLEWSPMWGEAETFTLPITTLFFWPSCTEAGYRMFTSDLVNAHIRNYQNVWGNFLRSDPRSKCALVDNVEGGWFTEAALKDMEEKGGAPFEELYLCNPKLPNWGFTSWDDFFTRQWRDMAKDRPVAPSTPTDVVITNPCESTPFNISLNVKEYDYFWIKGERYSLRHLFYNNSRTDDFVGGTVYQSYLSTTDYHRWHSPVDGNITDIVHVNGTYYAFSTAFGFNEDPNPDPTKNENWSQKYMANVATRMIIFIDAGDPIGTMAFVAIGMGETSSTENTVRVGDQVKKGQQLGMFHVGGSTYVMVFREGVDISFTKDAMPNPADAKRLRLNAAVGSVKKSS